MKMHLFSLLNLNNNKDIRHIDFVALHKAGYRGIVFDKDNCLVCVQRWSQLKFILLNRICVVFFSIEDPSS